MRYPYDTCQSMETRLSHFLNFSAICQNCGPDREPGSLVSIVSGYEIGERSIEVRSPAETKRIFSLTSMSKSALRLTQPPVQCVPWSFPLRQGHDADHSPPSCRGGEWVRTIYPLHPCASIGVLWDCFTLWTGQVNGFIMLTEFRETGC
jgi:hypothetical protein